MSHVEFHENQILWYGYLLLKQMLATVLASMVLQLLSGVCHISVFTKSCRQTEMLKALMFALFTCCLNPQEGQDLDTQMVDCSFREVGCLATLHPDELVTHLDTQIHYHTSVSLSLSVPYQHLPWWHFNKITRLVSLCDVHSKFIITLEVYVG
jgi:hypothetical protein